MNAHDVLEILDILAAEQVRVWIDGGWGIDALLGKETREHLDLDLAIRSEDLSIYIRAMIGHGFQTTRIDGPHNFVMTDAAGRSVDVHLVDLSSVSHDGRGVAVYGPNGLPYDVGSLSGRGWILGREVRCCAAWFQMISHTGYDLDKTDYQDVLALHDRFGLPLPEDYRRFHAGQKERW